MKPAFLYAAFSALGLLAIPPAAHASEGKTASAQILVKSSASWNGKPYTAYASGTPEMTVLKLTIEPWAALPWHTHPFPNAGYVLEGALTIVDKASGEKKTFHAGEAFTESVDDAHHGIAGNEKTVLLLVYAGIKGKPTSVPLPGQVKEY
ncbi:cupin domain-containing protein [Acetobacter sp. LMG 1627]|uniref:Cupin domain-containing protein n=2 Tax=Acetobacter conturbans TaxID=1737472 RepID=A0ABX0K2D3_9PROT|nr:cupin domain-containing protein [Acetobacter conturbans]